MKKDLYITINGSPSTGKTTLVSIIKKALENNGFQTIIEGEDSINTGYDKRLNLLRIESVKNNFPIIKIKQFHINHL
jgi:thymidylate kinase